MDRNKLEKIYNDLYNLADKKYGREAERIRAFYDGYKQGCEDIFKYAEQEMRMCKPEASGLLTQEEIECFKSYIESLLRGEKMEVIWGNSDWNEIYKKIISSPARMEE